MISVPTRPIKELKDFARITLNLGESSTVKFTITPDKLEGFDLNMQRVVQPGDFEIMVGKSSVEVLMDTLKVKVITRKYRIFYIPTFRPIVLRVLNLGTKTGAV